MSKRKKVKDTTDGPYTRDLQPSEHDDRPPAMLVPVSGRLLVFRDSGHKTAPLTKDDVYG